MKKEVFQKVVPSLLLGIAIGGVTGLIVGFLAFLGLQVLLPILEKRDDVNQNTLSTHDHEMLLELLWLGTQCGMTVPAILKTQHDLLPPTIQGHVLKLLNRCNAGMSWTDSLTLLSNSCSELQNLVVTLQLSINSGAPIAQSLEKSYELLRRKSATTQLRRIKSVAVKAVLPLGICFLPAFVLLTIVPIVANLIPQIFILGH